MAGMSPFEFMFSLLGLLLGLALAAVLAGPARAHLNDSWRDGGGTAA